LHTSLLSALSLNQVLGSQVLVQKDKIIKASLEERVAQKTTYSLFPSVSDKDFKKKPNTSEM